MKFVAGQTKKSLPADTTVTGQVGIGPKTTKGWFALDVELRVLLPGLAPEAAKALVDKAYEVCLYANATRDNVPVRIVIA